MDFLITLIVTVILAVSLREYIKRWPIPFYAICVALNVVLLISMFFSVPKAINWVLFTFMRKGCFSTALFVVVMYIGTFDRGSKASKWMRPIRAELSIMACILVIGHMVAYIASYLPAAFIGPLPRTNIVVSLAISLLLLALFLVLGGTSFRFVKHHMNARRWKRLQQLAYVFYALTFFHCIIMLLPSAMHGAQLATVKCAVYSIVFGVYAILRIFRAIADKREQVDLAETVIDQGFVSLD